MPAKKTVIAKKTSLGFIGSGNVFADLFLPDPELHLAKSNVVIEISGVMEERRLTHAKAARLMELSQPDLLDLLRGRTRPYTLDDLNERLRRLRA